MNSLNPTAMPPIQSKGTEAEAIPGETADWSPKREQFYDQSELKDIRGRPIQGLPPTFRAVFVLRGVEGLPTEERAEGLVWGLPAVKSRLLRARLQLRD